MLESFLLGVNGPARAAAKESRVWEGVLRASSPLQFGELPGLWFWPQPRSCQTHFSAPAWWPGPFWSHSPSPFSSSVLLIECDFSPHPALAHPTSSRCWAFLSSHKDLSYSYIPSRLQADQSLEHSSLLQFRGRGKQNNFKSTVSGSYLE